MSKAIIHTILGEKSANKESMKIYKTVIKYYIKRNIVSQKHVKNYILNLHKNKRINSFQFEYLENYMCMVYQGYAK